MVVVGGGGDNVRVLVKSAFTVRKLAHTGRHGHTKTSSTFTRDIEHVSTQALTLKVILRTTMGTNVTGRTYLAESDTTKKSAHHRSRGRIGGHCSVCVNATVRTPRRVLRRVSCMRSGREEAHGGMGGQNTRRTVVPCLLGMSPLPTPSPTHP